MTDGSLRSYSKASLDGLSDRRGLIDMGTSDNAGSGILLMCRSGGGCVDGLRCCWGWAGYLARCSILWCSLSDLVDNDRCWTSHSMGERAAPLVLGGTPIIMSYPTKC